VHVPDQVVTPMLSYERPGEAADWLVRVFGFTETFRLTEDDGRVGHVDLELDGGHVMLGCPSPADEGPRRHAESWRDHPYVVDGVHVLVPDVEAHLARARAEGATILSELEEGHGQRLYRAEDLDGHRWMFAQPL
jgi:PhnB protein